MATVKARPNLPMISTSKTHKKYLGEPGSPHFIPSSPLIERQFLSHEDEDELKRTCALVLANVQSSDEDVDQSFNYLASQIQDKEKSTKHSRKPSVPAAALSTAAPKPETLKVVNRTLEDSKPHTALSTSTAPISVLSDRTNSSQGNYYTPLTSAGITPGEPTVKPVSGPKIGFLGLSRGSTSSQDWKTAARPGSSANNHNENAHQDAAVSADHAIAWMNSYLEKRVSSKAELQHSSSSFGADYSSRKSSTRLSGTTSSARPATRSRSHRRKHGNRCSIGGPVDLDKRLPALPGQQEVERTKHITRLMKTIRRKNAEPSQTQAKTQQATESRESPFAPALGSAPDSSTNQLQVTHSLPMTLSHINHQQSAMGLLPLRSISEPVSPAPKGDGTRKRLGFRNHFMGRFEWKSQKGPLQTPVSPVLQTV